MNDILTDTRTKHIVMRAPHAFSPYMDSNWMREVAGHMLEWRWSDHSEHLIDALEALDRKQFPHLYSIKTATVGVNKFLRAIPADHDALLLSCSDKGELTITTCKEEDPGCEIEYYTDPSKHVDYAFGKLITCRKGIFVLNHDRYHGGSTNNTMYDCTECRDGGIPHSIVEIPGPPAPGNEVSMKGDPTHYRQCTGCKAVDGPWVPAPY